jgi:hypothetical protein
MNPNHDPTNGEFTSGGGPTAAHLAKLRRLHAPPTNLPKFEKLQAMNRADAKAHPAPPKSSAAAYRMYKSERALTEHPVRHVRLGRKI